MLIKEQIKDQNAYMLMDVLDELEPPTQSEKQAKESLKLVFKSLLKKDNNLLKLGGYGENTLFFIDLAEQKYKTLLSTPENKRNYTKAKNDITANFEMALSYLELIKV